MGQFAMVMLTEFIIMSRRRKTPVRMPIAADYIICLSMSLTRKLN